MMSMFTDDTPRTVLITGANGGLGRAIVRKLIGDGLHVVLTDITPCDEFIRAEGIADRVSYHRACDLESEQAVDDFVAEALTRTRIDVLINNAAHMGLMPLEVLTSVELRRFLRINIEAPFQLAKASSAGMRERGWGRIINLVSGSAWQPSPGFVGYISSKMGLIGLTRSLAVELGTAGITVNAITPALTRHAGNTTIFPEQFWEKVQDRQAIKRTGAPEDIVGAISFLASDASVFMTGQTMSVDGGSVLL